MKKLDTEELRSLGGDTLEEFITKLRDSYDRTMKDKPNVKQVSLECKEFDYSEGSYYACIEVTYEREETVSEQKNREARERRATENRKALYKQMKKEFEGE